MRIEPPTRMSNTSGFSGRENPFQSSERGRDAQGREPGRTPMKTDDSRRNVKEHETYKQVSLLGMHTDSIRALLVRVDRIAPRLKAGHLGRLEHVVKEVESSLENELKVIGRFDRARALRSPDTVEFSDDAINSLQTSGGRS